MSKGEYRNREKVETQKMSQIFKLISLSFWMKESQELDDCIISVRP